jgi:methylglyoxal synthase
MSSLALIAHDNKKVDLLAWATFNRETLNRFELVATRHTARLLERKVGLAVQELLSGPEGGDAQIAALAAVRAVDAVFFFVDPLSAQPHDPDIRALMRVCNVHNVPLATNLATADLIITALIERATHACDDPVIDSGMRCVAPAGELAASRRQR